MAPWRLRAKPCTICHTRIKRYKVPVRNYQAKNKTSGATMRAYLFLALFATYKVGCCMEASLWCFSSPPTWAPSYLAFQSKVTLQPASLPVRFDSDSYPIGVNSHTSKCMTNKPHLFEDLRLNKDKGQVNGISNGLATKREGTFKFSITGDDGKTHTIKIPNSLYVPKMRRCLLSPQHWTHEAGDKHTWIELKRQWHYTVFSIGGEERNLFPTSRRPTCQCSTPPHPWHATAHLSQHLKWWKPLSSKERMSFNVSQWRSHRGQQDN